MAMLSKKMTQNARNVNILILICSNINTLSIDNDIIDC